MEVNYKLNNVRELAGGDESFIADIAAAFVEEVPEAIALIKEGLAKKNYEQVYQNAHKIKPTIQMFELPIYNEIIVIQDWGKFEQAGKDVSKTFNKVNILIQAVTKELKSDFNL